MFDRISSERSAEHSLSSLLLAAVLNVGWSDGRTIVERVLPISCKHKHAIIARVLVTDDAVERPCWSLRRRASGCY